MDGIETVAVADDRMAARVELEGGGEEQAGGGVVRIIEAHVDLAADDVLFLLEFTLRDDREEHQAAEAFEKDRQRVGRPVDEIHGAVKAGVGVPMSASGLHGIGELIGIVIAGALEDHVLEEMRDAGAEVAVLVHRAGFHPELGGNHRRGGIRIKDQGEAVGQGLDSGGGAGVFHEISGLEPGSACSRNRHHATMDRGGSGGNAVDGRGRLICLEILQTEPAFPDVGALADQSGAACRTAR